jgi:hypothetical protein
MAFDAGEKPEKCPNPECTGQGEFIFRGFRFQYDARAQVGTLRVNQVPRTRITTWECEACHAMIEVVRDL